MIPVIEHFHMKLAEVDLRFQAAHQDLKDYIGRRFTDNELRYQQRFDAQTKALDAALAAQKEAVQTALVAAEKATSKAEISADKRFDSVNEFRKTLTDQTSTFIPRVEAEARLASLAEKVDDLKSSAQMHEGKTQGLSSGWGYLVAGIGILLVIINMIISWVTSH